MNTKDTAGYSYTRVMSESLEEWNAKLESFYCRDDFSDVLERFDRAEADNRLFVRRELGRMCDVRDLDTDALMEDRSLLERVPTREEVLGELVELFHDNYLNCYGAEDFMTRIVRRLAPEYAGDSVRLAILKKFIRGAGYRWKGGKQTDRKYRTGAILQWASDRMTSEERQALDSLSEEEQLERLAAGLDDSIFSDTHRNIELDEREQFLLMATRLSKWVGNLVITTDREAAKENAGTDAARMEDLPMPDETARSLRVFCEANGRPDEVANRNVDRLQWIADVLERGVLSAEREAEFMANIYPSLYAEFKHFLHATYCEKRDGTYQELWELFKTNRRDARKKKAADWELLQLCDDYAEGKFRTNGGKTRVYLYYFAIMFGMTLHLSENDEPDSQTDLEKNLFEDYYNDNVLRYLQEEYVNPETASKYESEPAGDGINYKNYAEVIYLYYLCRTDLPYTPGERIDRAEKLIVSCRNKAVKEDLPMPYMQRTDDDEEKFTDYYRETHFQHLLHLPEDQLEAYLLENYCVMAEHGEGLSRTMVSAEEEAAYDTVEAIMEYINDFYELSVQTTQMMREESEADTEKAMREEASYNRDGYFRWELAAELRRRYAKEPEFLRIVDRLDDRLSHPQRHISPEEKRVSRAAFLSLCLSDYITQMFEYEEEYRENVISFPKLYEDFVGEIDAKLQAARFQPFKGTNLMDFYILLSLYYYIVQNGKNLA